uniref:Uncharacterized protein n=1 Tax=Romanomermis culicivorax TaxID=13658 RepID=A0A915KEJ4_ROMCU
MQARLAKRAGSLLCTTRAAFSFSDSSKAFKASKIDDLNRRHIMMHRRYIVLLYQPGRVIRRPFPYFGCVSRERLFVERLDLADGFEI